MVSADFQLLLGDELRHTFTEDDNRNVVGAYFYDSGEDEGAYEIDDEKFSCSRLDHVFRPTLDNKATDKSKHNFFGTQRVSGGMSTTMTAKVYMEHEEGTRMCT